MGRRANLRLAYLAAASRSTAITVSSSRPRASLITARSIQPAGYTNPGVATGTPNMITVSPSNPTASSIPNTQAPVTAASIIAQSCPSGIASQPCGCSVDTASMQTLFTTSINNRLLMWPPPDSSFANCSGVTGTNATQKAGVIVGTAGGLTAAAAMAAGAAAGSVVPVVGTIAGAVGGLILGLVGGSHAKATAAQNSALCTAVPTANAQLQAVDAALAAGTMTPAQAATNYSQIQAQFTAAMKQGTSYKQCDALYAYNLALQMVIAARTADLAELSTSATGASVLGNSSDLLYLGGAALLAYLLFA